MSRLLSILLVSALVGCSWLTPQAPFDSAEYDKLNQIYTNASLFKQDCADQAKTLANFTKLNAESKALVNYSSDLPNNAISIDLAKNLDTIVTSGYQFYQDSKPHNKLFCELKLEGIIKASGTIKASVAQRRRP
jgi:hypothetical protein